MNLYILTKGLNSYILVMLKLKLNFRYCYNLKMLVNSIILAIVI